MTRGQWLLIAGLAVAAVAVWAALIGQLLAPPGPVAQDAILVEVTEPPGASASSVRPTETATAEPATPDPEPTPSPEPTSTPAPAEATSTPEPPSGEGSRAAYLVFLGRLDAARVAAQGLNEDLRSAGEAGDTARVRATAASMADLVDGERAWLDANPPAACYAEAHEAADDLLAGYGEVAGQATRWSEARGLDVLAALSDLYTAVEEASARAAAVGHALDAVECPA